MIAVDISPSRACVAAIPFIGGFIEEYRQSQERAEVQWNQPLDFEKVNPQRGLVFCHLFYTQKQWIGVFLGVALFIAGLCAGILKTHSRFMIGAALVWLTGSLLIGRKICCIELKMAQIRLFVNSPAYLIGLIGRMALLEVQLAALQQQVAWLEAQDALGQAEIGALRQQIDALRRQLTLRQMDRQDAKRDWLQSTGIAG